MRTSFNSSLLAAARGSLTALVVCLAGLMVPGAAQAGESPYRFAPYVDMADYPPPKLDAIGAASGVRSMSLGFVTARDRNRSDEPVDPVCEPTWGGYADYAAGGEAPYLLGKADAFRAATPGNEVVLSFGGAAGTELAEVCGSVEELSAAYADVVDAYGAQRVDFDIEGDELDPGSAEANARRADAIALLQSSNPALEVTFTLPVSTRGLEPLGSELVADALDSGVDVEAVNAMAMDYGTTGRNPDMGRLAIGVAKAMRGQLDEIYASRGAELGEAELWRKVAVTPMIGINDVKREVFDLGDARRLVEFAREKRLGMLGMWQLTRDAQCRRRVTTTQPRCSGVRQQRWGFAKALGRFRG